MRWSMLPASIAVHAAALVLFLIVPITADVELPTPWPARQSYIAAAAAPRLPVERKRAAVPRTTFAPVTAPDRISDPVDTSDAAEAEGGVPEVGGISTGVPAGFGVEGARLPLPPPPPPPVVQQPTVVRAGGQIREPRKIVHVPVRYPEYARQAHVEGMVIIEATIDERGTVTDARVLKSQPLLEAAALAAVRQWRYTPTLLNGVPVRVLLTITINFTLGDRHP